MTQKEHQRHRRLLIKFLATSPLMGLGLAYCSSNDTTTLPPVTNSSSDINEADLHQVISSIEEAINVFDFEGVARQNLPPAHFGYLATGTDNDETLKANRVGFSNIQLKARRLRGITSVDTSVELLGQKWDSPIIVCPVGSQKAFHPEGEIAVAKAAKNKGHLQVLSTVATSSVEEVALARQAPIWYQLYPTIEWEQTLEMVKRAEAAGCPAIVLTVDLTGDSNRETLLRYIRLDTRDCKSCHGPMQQNKPMISSFPSFDFNGSLDWDFVQKLKANTSMKVLIKGIVSGEDARLCLENGVDGIFVSNHGGRAEASARATIDCLPEVAEAINGQIPIILDSGIRRGADIFKALALGATAVGIGRPYMWGLSAFGQDGVEAVLGMLRKELEMVMAQMGTSAIDEIDASYLV